MILINATIATMDEGAGLIERGAICIEGGRIVWVGPEAELAGVVYDEALKPLSLLPSGKEGDRAPSDLRANLKGFPERGLGSGRIGIPSGKFEFQKFPSEFPQSSPTPSFPQGKKGLFDLGGRLVTPGLIDCHTHLVHAGDRAQEFDMRLKGATYEEIARAGGGILSTVRATRAASEDELLAAALPRLDQMIAEGVTTLEVKSGYGLSMADELKMLRAARRLESVRPVRVHASLLAAHATPPEYRGRADDYLDEVCIPALRAAAAEGLADSVDGFCEGVAFSPAQIARLFDAARAAGLPVRLHAEQLSNLGGAALAARYGALSADHLEYLDEAGAAAMAAAGTVAVILPGAFYTLRETRLPPIDLLRRHGVRMAVATDCNPGTAPMTSITLAMNMACTLFRMTPDEALAGVTRHAAAALGLSDCGRIAPGLRADLAVWEAWRPAELSYRIGATPLYARIQGGRFDA